MINSRGNAWPKLVLFLFAVLVLGSLLAPAFFAIGKDWVASPRVAESGNPIVEYLHREMSRAGFARYFNRALLVAALLMLWPLGRWMKLKWSDVLTPKDPERWRHLGLGFVVAFVPTLLLGAFLIEAGFHQWKKDLDWGKVASQAAVAAVAVALLEEFLFRGALFGFIRRSSTLKTTFWAVTLLFTVVHFLRPPGDLEMTRESLRWWSGLELTTVIFGHFFELDSILADFAMLFFVGVILTLTRIQTQSLWASIGLHAGWVFGLKLFSGVAYRTDHLKNTPVPLMGENLRVGLLPLIMVLITGALAFKLLRPRAPGAEE